jgi:two-component system, OmpR family, phosphate regulon sensor histidine kinase PhoR
MTWVTLLILYAAGLVLATVLELALDSSLGWVLLAAGSGSLLVWRRYQAAKVAAWLKAPSQSPPPKDVGPWVEVVEELDRYIGIQQDLLEESQETTAAVMAAAQALPVGVIALDRNLDIIWFNRAAQQHLDLDEGSDVGGNLLHFVRQPEFVRYARQSVWPEPITQTLHRGKSERLLMMQFVTYARDQRLLITRDLTQLDRLERTRRDFVANVSHELRTPLTVLAGFLETIREAPPDALTPEQRSYYLDLMQDQANRMQSIVSDLLTLSDLENNPNAESSSVDVAALLNSARQQVQALSADQHSFEWHIDEELKVWGNASELSSAFSNLLTNAVRYTPPGGTITVRWEELPAGGARYSVTDTGIGIASEHIPRLSERFYRVDRGRSRSVGGTGLGLAITKHIAIRHDATLEIQSRLGHGSTFSLVFGSNRIPSRT